MKKVRNYVLLFATLGCSLPIVSMNNILELFKVRPYNRIISNVDRAYVNNLFHGMRRELIDNHAIIDNKIDKKISDLQTNVCEELEKLNNAIDSVNRQVANLQTNAGKELNNAVYGGDKQFVNLQTNAHEELNNAINRADRLVANLQTNVREELDNAIDRIDRLVANLQTNAGKDPYAWEIANLKASMRELNNDLNKVDRLVNDIHNYRFTLIMSAAGLACASMVVFKYLFMNNKS